MNLTQTKYGSKIKTTFEVVFIYLLAFITFLTFYKEINVSLYSLLGWSSLLAFFSIIVAMLGYIGYNFIVVLKNLKV